MNSRQLYYKLSPAWRRRARRILFAPSDFITLLKGRPYYNGIPIPLRGEVFIGGGDFLEVGLQLKSFFINHCGLSPEESVLDIGSGIGRLAIPLTDYLAPTAIYEGFDVVEQAVNDCQKRISSRFSNFSFTHVPLGNDLYTETGQPAESFTFPYSDNMFSFVYATSVFTHMSQQEVANYLCEAYRVTKPGGRFLATFFIMDDVALAHSSDSSFSFPDQEGAVWYMDEKVKGANVAYTPKLIANMANDAGWTKQETLWGAWSGRPEPTSGGQDTMIFYKDEDEGSKRQLS